MESRILIIGAGGHSKVLIEALFSQSIPILGCLDNAANRMGTTLLGVPVIGSDSELIHFSPESVQLINGLGSTRDTALRKRTYLALKQRGYSFSQVNHSSAMIARDVSLGEGVQVMAGVVIQPSVKIGDNSIINTRAVIEHDCMIGHHVHIAPSATLCGKVTVGDGVHIGVGASVIQGIHIGSGSFIAAGAVVVEDVPDGATVMGVPAKEVRLS